MCGVLDGNPILRRIGGSGNYYRDDPHERSHARLVAVPRCRQYSYGDRFELLRAFSLRKGCNPSLWRIRRIVIIRIMYL